MSRSYDLSDSYNRYEQSENCELLSIFHFGSIVLICIFYFRYVRALGAVYLRLTAASIEVYKYLEPLYNDYRKIRWMDNMGSKH